MLEVKNVSKTMDGLPILANLSLRIGEHEIVSLVSPSGCGKSTLLNLIAGIAGEYEGSIDRHGARTGYVFQEDRILPWMTVYENLKIVRDDTDEARIRELIDRMHLTGFEDYYPAQLSGGMRQRCGIARAFYYGSDLLLMDEPFKSLDPLLRIEMLENLVENWERESGSVLFVTHDVDEALLISDRILVMDNRPTRVLREIVPGDGGRGFRTVDDADPDRNTDEKGVSSVSGTAADKKYNSRLRDLDDPETTRVRNELMAELRKLSTAQRTIAV